MLVLISVFGCGGSIEHNQCSVTYNENDKYILYDRFNENENQIQLTGFEDEIVNNGTVTLFDTDTGNVCDSIDITNYNKICYTYRYTSNVYFNVTSNCGEFSDQAIDHENEINAVYYYCTDVSLHNCSIDEITIDGTITLDSVYLSN